MNRNTAQFFKTSVSMIRPGIEPSQLALMVRAHPILYHLAGVEESLNRNALLLRLRVGRTCKISRHNLITKDARPSKCSVLGYVAFGQKRLETPDLYC